MRAFYADCSVSVNSVIGFARFIASMLCCTIRFSFFYPALTASLNMQTSQESSVSNFTVPGPIGPIPVRLYQPAGIVRHGAQQPLVLYFHGGGFTSGGLDDADLQAQYISRHSRAVVLSVAYALAPAKPFPAAPEDAYAAACWAIAHAQQLHVDPLRIAVAGDDAGGNLAASLTMISRDRCAVPLVGQVLISPMLDPSMTLLDDATRLNSDMTAETCAASYRQYLPRTMQRLHPYAAPLEASRLAGLPPAFIATAGRDVLRTEAEKYAAALIHAGVHTQVARFADLTHGALRHYLPLLADIAAFLCRRFKANGPGATSFSIPSSL